MTGSQNEDEIERDARLEKRLIYQGLISLVVVIAIVIVRELVLS